MKFTTSGTIKSNVSLAAFSTSTSSFKRYGAFDSFFVLSSSTFLTDQVVFALKCRNKQKIVSLRNLSPLRNPSEFQSPTDFRQTQEKPRFVSKDLIYFLQILPAAYSLSKLFIWAIVPTSPVLSRYLLEFNLIKQ